MNELENPLEGLKYEKIWNLGHKNADGLLDDPVIVEEKIDGSQFNFGVLGGSLRCFSKENELNVLNPEGMFKEAVTTAQTLVPLLRPGFMYRCEYLRRPKHNVLAYGRIPQAHLMLLEIENIEGCKHCPKPYAPREYKEAEAERIGLECVPLIYQGRVTAKLLEEWLTRESFLGNVKIEGVVIKNYEHGLFGKWVSTEFREHMKQKPMRLRQGPFDSLGKEFGTPARWQKAAQHLRERGELQEAPEDIGPLIREVGLDILAEHEAELRERAWKKAWPNIQKAATAGLADWYKEQLAEASLRGLD